ncbi:MAG: peptidoglycan-binding protein [Alphaproteobacteria bacterium]|nr:peptidoglycan-binding protein [Alphaproteobacteria bacterium]
MYSEKFEKAFDYVIANEGGYVFDLDDLGGETKFGISKKSYPALNIKALTLDQAKEIYHRDFWLNGKFEQINDKNIATQLFDFVVNFGFRTGITIVQRALRAGGIIVQEDGLIGPQTLSAINFSEPKVLLAAMKSEAAGKYRLLAAQNSKMSKFLNGWLNRAYRVL